MTNNHMAWVILYRFIDVLTLIIMGILFKVLVFNVPAKMFAIDDPQHQREAKQLAMVWKNYFAVGMVLLLWAWLWPSSLAWLQPGIDALSTIFGSVKIAARLNARPLVAQLAFVYSGLLGIVLCAVFLPIIALGTIRLYSPQTYLAKLAQRVPSRFKRFMVFYSGLPIPFILLLFKVLWLDDGYVMSRPVGWRTALYYGSNPVVGVMVIAMGITFSIMLSGYVIHYFMVSRYLVNKIR